MPLHRRTSLFETAHGHVGRCPCCGLLEIRFGQALLALAEDDLPHVLDQLGEAESQAEQPAADVGGTGRDVTLLLGDSGCGWVFEPSEAAELHRLVSGARLLLELAA